MAGSFQFKNVFGSELRTILSRAAVIYSLRDLGGAAAIRVRRASDDAEQDVGFSGGDFDTATLATFCAGTDGYAKVIYDQSANGSDASQADPDKQAKVYDSATGVELDNGKPCLLFDGADDLYLASVVASSQPLTVFAVNKPVAVGNKYLISAAGVILWCSNTQRRIYAGSNVESGVITGSQELWSGLWNGANTEMYVDGSPAGSGDAGSGTQGATLSISNASAPWKDSIQEIIYFQADEWAHRQTIEADINRYYGVY